MLVVTAQNEAPQAPQAAAQAPVGAGPVVLAPSGSPSEVYDAYRNQRNELRNQMSRLEDRRSDISRQLRRENLPSSEVAALENRISEIDQRISALEKEIATADAAVARAAAVPGAVVPPPPPPPRQGPPEEFFVVLVIFMFIFLLPLTIAYARRIWRRGAAVVTAIPQELMERFTRLEQGLDAVAVEVERIGEGQRYMTRLWAEQQQRGLKAGANVTGAPSDDT